jgi:hypothetical protein
MNRYVWISDKSYEVVDDEGPTVRYSRVMLVAVLIEHQRLEDGTCCCGWGPLGASFAEHVATRYEAAMGGRFQ